MNMFAGLKILSVERPIRFDRAGNPHPVNTVVYYNFGQHVKLKVNDEQYKQAEEEFRRQQNA